jgi:acetylornithine deacetylase
MCKMSDSTVHTKHPTASSQDLIVDWVEQHRDDIIGLTRSLVRFPSENKPPHGNEKDCQMFVADFLRDLGCRVDIFRPDEVEGLTDHPAYWPGRDYTDRPNVIGVLTSQPEEQPRKANRRRSLLFSGHTDVVPTVGDGQFGWWDGTIDGGKLYGRGSNDMKGGIAAYLMAGRCVKELGLELKGDLILETVVDEEFGGANGTLACRLRGYNADLAINPEPNNMLLSAAHRGGQQFRLFLTAKGMGMGFGQTELPDPVIGMGHVLVALEKYNTERNARTKPPGFEDVAFPIMPFVLKAGDLLPWGTGEAIPETAWVEFWVEIPPGVTREQLQSELKSVAQEAIEGAPTLRGGSARWEERTRFLPGSTMSEDNPVIKILAEKFAFVTREAPKRGPAPFACDGFMFNLHSPTPVVIFGPQGGNAHAPDEWVDVEDLITLTKTFALTIADWLM